VIQAHEGMMRFLYMIRVTSSTTRRLLRRAQFEFQLNSESFRARRAAVKHSRNPLVFVPGMGDGSR
jgi:hypothetical protein